MPPSWLPTPLSIGILTTTAQATRRRSSTTCAWRASRSASRRSSRSWRMKIADLDVNRIGYGAMRVIDNPDIWGPPKDKANAHRVLRRADELGANFFDTSEGFRAPYRQNTNAHHTHPH